jgi:phytanoyl-CoA hydroxylase
MMGSRDFVPLQTPFERDGFVHVKGFLSPSELADVRRRVERYKVEIAPTLESYRVLYDVEGGVRSIKQMVDLDKADPCFADLIDGDGRRLATALLGEDALPQTVEYFDKGPGIGKPTPPHQDGYYFCLKPNHAVTVWVALDDCDEENGCMSYVSGSHRNGIIDHHASGVVGFSQGLDYAPSPGEKLFVAKGGAGDCFAHHSVTIHLAGANRSDRHRQSLGMIYYGRSAHRDEDAFARYKANVEQQRKQYGAGATA